MSSTEAEVTALAEVSVEALWLKELLLDFQEQISEPIVINEDNQSCIKIIDGFKVNKTERNTLISSSISLKPMKLRTSSNVNIVPQLICRLTKPLSAKRIKDIRIKLNISNNLEREGELNYLQRYLN